MFGAAYCLVAAYAFVGLLDALQFSGGVLVLVGVGEIGLVGLLHDIFFEAVDQTSLTP